MVYSKMGDYPDQIRTKHPTLALITLVLALISTSFLMMPSISYAEMASGEETSPTLGIYTPASVEAGDIYEVQLWYHWKNSQNIGRGECFIDYPNDSYVFVDAEGNELTGDEFNEAVTAPDFDTAAATVESVMGTDTQDAKLVIKYSSIVRLYNFENNIKWCSVRVKAKQSGTPVFKLQNTAENAVTFYSTSTSSTIRSSTGSTSSKYLHLLYCDQKNDSYDIDEVDSFYAQLAEFAELKDNIIYNDCKDPAAARTKIGEFGDALRVCDNSADMIPIVANAKAYAAEQLEFSDEERNALIAYYIGLLDPEGIEAENYENWGTTLGAKVSEGVTAIQSAETRSTIKSAYDRVKSAIEPLVKAGQYIKELREYKYEAAHVKENYEEKLGDGIRLLQYAVTNQEVENAFKTAKGYIDSIVEWPEIVNGVYQIKTADDMQWFADVNNGNLNLTYNDLNVELCNDIDMSTVCSESLEQPWTRINNYYGTFEGNGHTLKNYYGNGPLFGNVEKDGVIRNFTLEGVVRSNNNAASITSLNRGLMQNVVNKANVSSSMFAAGISISGVGRYENCINYGNVTAGNMVNGWSGQQYAIGGITLGGGYLTRCVNYGDLTFNVLKKLSCHEYCGGICGLSSSSVRFCRNCGDITVVFADGITLAENGKMFIGGILGGLTDFSPQSNDLYGNVSEGKIIVENLGESYLGAGAILGLDPYSFYSNADYTEEDFKNVGGNVYAVDILNDVCVSEYGSEIPEGVKIGKAVEDMKAISYEDIYYLNSGDGLAEGSGTWTRTEDGVDYAENAADSIFRVRMLNGYGDYVALKQGGEICDSDVYIKGKKTFKLEILKEGYSFSRLYVSGVNQLDEAGDDNYFYVFANGRQDYDIEAVVTSQKTVDDIKEKINAIGIVSNLSGDAIEAARKAYDEASEGDREEVGDELTEKLEKAEEAYKYLSSFTVNVDKNEFTYDGTAKEPAVEAVYTKKAEEGEPAPEPVLLVNGTDYDLAYENNTDAGTGSAVLTLKGEYASDGVLKAEFTILPVDISSAKVTLSGVKFQETGKEIKPNVTVSIDDNVLAADKDYKVSYENNVKAGKARVVVTGQGNYSGTVSQEFVIDNKSADPKKGATVKSGNMRYTVSKAVAANGTGGTVSVSTPGSKNTKAVSIPAKITVNGKKYKVTEIKPNAFKGMKSLKSVVIGVNIRKIGKSAFMNCKKLKKITFKTKKLKNVGSSAFKKINKKAVIKVPKGKLKAYKKLLKGKVQPKSVKIK